MSLLRNKKLLYTRKKKDFSVSIVNETKKFKLWQRNLD